MNAKSAIMLEEYFFLSFTIFTVLCTSPTECNSNNQIEKGEKYYAELERKSQSYGECWKVAMSNLLTGCKQLTEDVQSRLALSFANCFLIHSGVDSCFCVEDVPISDCLKNCSDRVFSTYREFFTHTQSVCHYLQHREWQVEAAKTALLLTENSQKISRKLDESAQSQAKILDLQRSALTEQRKSISHSKILNAELIQSREKAKDLYNEFKTTTYEQKLLLFEMFDRMKNLQNFVLGEFTGVYTVAYYLVIATLVYILTSVPRTADARIWLILVISLNAVSEKFLTSYILQGNSMEVNPIITSEFLYVRIWLCRKVACLICVITLIISYYRYKDYNAINNELLREIQQQNMELQSFLKGLAFHENISSTFKSSMDHLFEDRKLVFNAIATDNKLEKLSTPSRNFKRKISPRSNDVENKKNGFSSSMSLEGSPHNPKVSPKKKIPNLVKKNTFVKHSDNSINIAMLVEKHSLDIESPISPSGRRYNLRSSSRMNSPLSPV